jgi:mannose/fructose/N-acetylgalactosamine-specific phosphotransferase system component IIC
MKMRIVSAILVGIVLYAIVIVLASIQRDLTLPQLILMLITPFVIGFLAGGVKNGLILGFTVPFVMLIVEVAVLQPGVFSDPNVALAAVLMTALPFGLISAGLGAAGGFAGRRAFKK